MTYATIEEAWGGLDGSSMRKTRTRSNGNDEQDLHPCHKKQLKREKKMNKKAAKAKRGLYECNYNSDGYQSQNCNELVQRNAQYNNEKKNIVTGIPNVPFQYYGNGYAGLYPLLPQYPWPEYAKRDYLMYSPTVSNAFYGNPYYYYPEVASQIHQSQMNNCIQPNYNNYYNPQGFVPYPYYSPPLNQNQRNIIARVSQEDFQKLNKHGKMIEHFNGNCSSKMMNQHQVTIMFIFFMIILSIVLCVFLLAIAAHFYK